MSRGLLLLIPVETLRLVMSNGFDAHKECHISIILEPTTHDIGQSPGVITQEDRNDQDWLNSENLDAFDIIANFWEAVNLQQ